MVAKNQPNKIYQKFKQAKKMTIDSHQHFWRLKRGDYDWLTKDIGAIYRDFNPCDLKPILKANGIDATILIQATDTEEETEFMLSLADENDWIKGVVGWVNMQSDISCEKINKFAEHPKFVGIRPMIQDIKDDNWMMGEEIKPAIQTLIELNLTFDALLLPKHLEIFKQFIARYPDLKIAIDHCAKPDIKNNVFQPWADQMAEIAQHKQIYCKLSGIVTEAADDWTIDDIKPYIEHILNIFGTERVIFGSDWPVINISSDYQEWLTICKKLTAKMTEDEKTNIFAKNASVFYLNNRLI